MAEMSPTEADTILDVGVTDAAWRSSNFLEALYPWPGRITAVGMTEMPTFEAAFPEVTFVRADGRSLPFPDASFAIGFSNAVIEHVGAREQQRLFIAEMLRTCRRVFIATPNARFPIDPHTLLPFVHWLPRPVRHPILRWTGNRRWVGEEALNPLHAGALRSLFPAGTAVRIVRQRVLRATTVIIAVVEPGIG